MTLKRYGILRPFAASFALASGISIYACAMAQGVDDFALEAGNRAGILEFCQARGFARTDDIADARAVLNNRPQMPAQGKLADAKAEGKNGRLLAAGQYFDLTGLAADQHMTLAEMCGSIAANAQIAAKLVRQP